jgi:hypothetical protein
MNELAKLKRRIRQLERCLQAVLTILANHLEDMERSHGPENEPSPATEAITAALNRIGRTL